MSADDTKPTTTKRILHSATPSGYFEQIGVKSTAGKWAVAIFYPFWLVCDIAVVLGWWVLFAIICVLISPFWIYGRLTKKGPYAPDAAKARD